MRRKRKMTQDNFAEYFCVASDKRLRSSILSEFALYYRAGIFCDVAIYCPASESDDLSSQPAVQQDVWMSPRKSQFKLHFRNEDLKCCNVHGSGFKIS